MKNLKMIITAVIVLLIVGIGIGVGIRMLPFILGVCVGFLLEKYYEKYKNENK